MLLLRRILCMYAVVTTLMKTYRCAAVMEGPDSTSTPLVDKDLAENSENSINNATDYFMKYTGFVKPNPTPEESSVDGHGNPVPKLDITRTPDFMERVAILQQEAGLEVTGILSSKEIKVMTQGRCGMTDPPRDANAPANYQVKKKWDKIYDHSTKKYRLTYSFLNSEFDMTVPISHADIERGVLSAMCIWERNSNVRFVKKYAENESKKANIVITFGIGNHGDYFPFDGKGGTLAHAFYPPGGGLHFDGEERWFLSIANKNDNRDWRDIFTVAAHEIGHNLGLMHSDKSSALMAPFYAFKNSFEDYKLPTDDRNAIGSLYGYYDSRVDPINERSSACRSLHERFDVKHGVVKPQPTRSTTTTMRSTTRRTTTTQRTTKRTTTTTGGGSGAECTDSHGALGRYCKLWKDQGLCSKDKHKPSMARLCPRTCGMCDGEPKVCAIKNYDAVTVMYDSDRFFDGFFFQGKNQIRSTISFSLPYNDKRTLLNDHNDLKEFMTFTSDPKIIHPDTYKIEGFFPGTRELIAFLPGPTWYLVFLKNGRVRQYTRGAPTEIFLNERNIRDLFPQYPHNTLDAAFAENNKYIIFYKDRMWQYRKSRTSQMLDRRELYKEVMFRPIKNKTNVSILTWGGVDACNLDGVFEYKGMPYFLKGSLFWPAKDTEPAVARDLAYHFFGCGQGDAKQYPVPSGCKQVRGRILSDGGNHASHFSSSRTMVYFVCFLISMMLILDK